MADINKGLNRREFMKISSIGVGAGIAMGSFGNVFGAEMDKTGSSDKKSSLPLRELGKTGMMVTPVSVGVMRCKDPIVLKRAYELGVNFFDTARGYMGGNNEKTVAEALGGVRDKVYIQTKLKHSYQETVAEERITKYKDESQLRADLEDSLRALNTDYIDVLLLHNNDCFNDITQEEQLSFLQKVKKEGKVRFVGFSTHSNMDTLLDYAADKGIWDVILTTYNFTSSPELKKAIQKCADNGVGIVAMKTQVPITNRRSPRYPETIEGLNHHQAALSLVLSDKNVGCAVPGVTTVQMVEENFEVMKQGRIAFLDRRELHSVCSKKGIACDMCGRCDLVCEKGVPARDMMRVMLYHKGYGDFTLAKETFDEIGGALASKVCSDCDSCTFNCVQKLAIKDKILEAQRLFA